MTPPTCPIDYSCQFTLVHPRIIYHSTDPWYQGTLGWVAGIIIGIAIVLLLAFIASLVHETATHRRDRRAYEREQIRNQAHELAMAEQRTLQAEQAKGNPEMLKMIREMA